MKDQGNSRRQSTFHVLFALAQVHIWSSIFNKPSWEGYIAIANDNGNNFPLWCLLSQSFDVCLTPLHIINLKTIAILIESSYWCLVEAPRSFVRHCSLFLQDELQHLQELWFYCMGLLHGNRCEETFLSELSLNLWRVAPRCWGWPCGLISSAPIGLTSLFVVASYTSDA